MKQFFIFLLTVFLIFGCKPGKTENETDVQGDHAKSNITGEFTVSGAYALSPVVRKWADDFMKIHPAVKINILETGTGQGIVDLLDKKTDLAMISRPLLDEEKEAGIWIMPVAKDGVVLITNQNNPYLPRMMKQGLSPDEVQQLFTAETPPLWGKLLDTSGNDKPVVYTSSDPSGAADMLAGFCYRKASDLKGIGVTGDNEMISSVRSNPMAVGFCNLSFAFSVPSGERVENIQIIPFDLDFDNSIGRTEKPFQNLDVAHRSIWLGIYPENLCRELTIGSMGKPINPAIVGFLNYVLSEGQEIIKERGLCELNNVYIRYAKESLQ